MAQRAAYSPLDEARNQGPQARPPNQYGGAQPRNGLASGTARPQYGQSFMQSLLRRMFSGQGRPRFQRATQLPGGYKPGYSRRFSKRSAQPDAWAGGSRDFQEGGDGRSGMIQGDAWIGQNTFKPGEQGRPTTYTTPSGETAQRGYFKGGPNLTQPGASRQEDAMRNQNNGAQNIQGIGDAASTTEEFGETGNDWTARQGQPIPRRQAQTQRKRQDVGWLFGDRMGGL